MDTGNLLLDNYSSVIFFFNYSNIGFLSWTYKTLEHFFLSPNKQAEHHKTNECPLAAFLLRLCRSLNFDKVEVENCTILYSPIVWQIYLYSDVVVTHGRVIEVHFVQNYSSVDRISVHLHLLPLNLLMFLRALQMNRYWVCSSRIVSLAIFKQSDVK